MPIDLVNCLAILAMPASRELLRCRNLGKMEDAGFQDVKYFWFNMRGRTAMMTEHGGY